MDVNLCEYTRHYQIVHLKWVNQRYKLNTMKNKKNKL